MAVQIDNKGEVSTVLTMKDEASAVVQQFAQNTDKSLAQAAGAVEESGKKAGEAITEAARKSHTDWEKTGKTIAGVAVAVGTFALGAAGYGMKLADSAADMAEKIGVTAQWVSKLDYAAGLADTSIGKVAVMVREMNRRLVEADEKGGKVAIVLGEMGLSAQRLREAGPEKAFELIVQALAKIEDPMKRTQAAAALMGRSADDAVKLAKALREAGGDATTFGLVLSNEAYAGSSKFNDSLYRLNQQMKGIPTIVANHVAPAFGEMARIFADAVRDSGVLRGVANGLGIALRGIASVVVLIGGAFGVAGKLMGGFSAIMGQLITGNWKGALEAAKALAGDLGESLDKLREIEGKLLGMSGTGGQGGMQKMAWAPGVGTGTWSDMLPGADAKTAANDAEYEAQRTHYDRLTELHQSWQLTLGGIDEREVNRRRDLWKNDTAYRLAVTESFFGTMAGLMETKSKTLFKIGQAFAIADTIMQTYRAAQGAYAAFAWIPLIGPALGAAAAVAAIAVGMARVNAIRSASIGGGAAAPVYSASPTTGIPTAPTQAANDGNFQNQPAVTQAQPRFTRSENVTIVGDFFTQEWMREKWIPMINKAQRDGVYLELHVQAA